MQRVQPGAHFGQVGQQRGVGLIDQLGQAKDLIRDPLEILFDIAA